MTKLRILMLCHSFNSLSQRLFAELRAMGHTLSVELDINDRVTEEAVSLFVPDMVLAPFLKRRIPASVWQRVHSFVVHPGPPGDRGPSALDWAVLNGSGEWGVTVLQANEEFDAGPVWAYENFAMREASKGSLYRREVADAAWRAVSRVVERFSRGERQAPTWPNLTPSHWRPGMLQKDRKIDWYADSSRDVLAKIRSADGQPGVADALWGQPCALHSAHAASQAVMAEFWSSAPGDVLAVRDGALLRRTRDGGIWISQARRIGLTNSGSEASSFKQVAAELFPAEVARLPMRSVPLMRPDDEWGEIRYSEHGPPGARVGCLYFDFYNGAMSTDRCKRLRAALLEVRTRPNRVLLLMGGEDFYCNGIDLNSIEAASSCPGGSAADASWRNIQAMNDVVLDVLMTTDRYTVSVLRGNAGAGGAFLTLATDEVWAHEGVVLNPHYKNMGNLYGSEYWTYLLPRRLGESGAKALMQERLPLLARRAVSLGMIDYCDEAPRAGYVDRCLQRALELAASSDFEERIARKARRRAEDEAVRPLADYREHELAQMHRNFYGFDPSYHVARHHFVTKQPHAWTPRHLAHHR